VLAPLDTRPNNSVDLWIENDIFGITWSRVKHYPIRTPQKVVYDKFYSDFFKSVLKTLKINYKLDTTYFSYKDTELIDRYNNLCDKYKDFDILILNSTPMSGQYTYNKHIWDAHIMILSKHFKIVTTTKVDKNILCTFDENMSIKDIAALSTKAKVVIAVNSGVVPGLLNYYTLKNVKRFYTFDYGCCYSYPNFEDIQCLSDITIEELSKYIV